jgi:hypothetical protein
MTHEENRAWIMLVASVAAYAVYVVALLGRADGRRLAAVPYPGSLLWTVGGAIVVSVLADIAVGIAVVGSTARIVVYRRGLPQW